MLPVGLEPTIPTGERWQTYALDRAATWIGEEEFTNLNIITSLNIFMY